MNCQPPIIKLIVPDFQLKPLKQFLVTVITNKQKNGKKV
jgi:hypothetical protein